MNVLKKNIVTTIIPGNPGIPATPGRSARAAYCTTRTVLAREWIQPTGDQLALHGPTPVATLRAMNITECFPATPLIPASPGVPPTPQQINYSLNSGWNSWARSVNQIPAGNFCQLSISPGSRGAFFGLGRNGMEGLGIHAFPHGILSDSSGLWIYEAGVKVVRLSLTNDASDKLRIVRQSDLRIAYIITRGVQTFSYTSLEIGSALPLYAYGYLYSGGDSVNSAEIITGEVQYGSA